MKDILGGLVDISFDEVILWSKKHLIPLALVASLVMGGVGSFFGYRYIKHSREEEAHTVLFDCLAQYEQALHRKAEWDDVIAMSRAGYEKYEKTAIAPYLLAIEVDALLAKQEDQAALERLDTMMAKLSVHTPLYPLFCTKQALLRMDSADQELQHKGLQTLEHLASDSANIYRDEAQYYLGLYHRERGESEKALAAWKPLFALNDEHLPQQAQSPWAALAKDKSNGLE